MTDDHTYALNGKFIHDYYLVANNLQKGYCKAIAMAFEDSDWSFTRT